MKDFSPQEWEHVEGVLREIKALLDREGLAFHQAYEDATIYYRVDLRPLPVRGWNWPEVRGNTVSLEDMDLEY